MVIHRRSHLGHVPTKAGTVYGYLWRRRPCRTIAYNYDAKSPIDDNTIHPPYVDIEHAFLRSREAEVFDTLVRVAGHTLLVSSYFDSDLDPNPNLKRDFPHILWRGEIAVLFVGKRKPFVKRAPPDLVVRSAMARYMGLCIAHVELGAEFPGYITIDGPIAISDENVLVN